MHSNIHSFLFYLNRNIKSPYQGHSGLKISCFSWVTQPKENVHKSVNIQPTFTKLGNIVAEYVYYEFKLLNGSFLNIHTFQD